MWLYCWTFTCLHLHIMLDSSLILCIADNISKWFDVQVKEENWSRSIRMASRPSQPRVMLPSVILNLAMRISTIFTTWITPKILLLYASWSLGNPGVVHEASILCLPWLLPSIIRSSFPHQSLKELSLTAIASPFLMASTICLSFYSVDLYPGFQELAWEVLFFSTVSPTLLHLMCTSLNVYTFFTTPHEGVYLVISLLILKKRLWLSLPCRLMMGL